MERCPPHSSCIRHGPANFSCSCNPPREWDSRAAQCILPTPMSLDQSAPSSSIPASSAPASSIHVVLSVDREHYPGLLVVLHTLIRHTSDPEQLHVHVVVAGEPQMVVQQLLDCHGLREEAQVTTQSWLCRFMIVHLSFSLQQVEVVSFHSRELQGLVRVAASRKEVGNLASPANFARFFFHE